MIVSTHLQADVIGLSGTRLRAPLGRRYRHQRVGVRDIIHFVFAVTFRGNLELLRGISGSEDFCPLAAALPCGPEAGDGLRCGCRPSGVLRKPPSASTPCAGRSWRALLQEGEVQDMLMKMEPHMVRAEFWTGSAVLSRRVGEEEGAEVAHRCDIEYRDGQAKLGLMSHQSRDRLDKGWSRRGCGRTTRSRRFSPG